MYCHSRPSVGSLARCCRSLVVPSAWHVHIQVQLRRFLSQHAVGLHQAVHDIEDEAMLAHHLDVRQVAQNRARRAQAECLHEMVGHIACSVRGCWGRQYPSAVPRYRWRATDPSIPARPAHLAVGVFGCLGITQACTQGPREVRQQQVVASQRQPLGTGVGQGRRVAIRLWQGIAL